MALTVIPSEWRKIVCAILEAEDPSAIQWTNDAWQRYESGFTRYDSALDPPWYTPSRYEVYDPLMRFLETEGAKGCLVAMKTPAGETYEFFFRFLGTKAYGKILLRSNRKQIVIFSAHPPLKPKLSCE
jgi:hypothetical protein